MAFDMNHSSIPFEKVAGLTDEQKVKEAFEVCQELRLIGKGKKPVSREYLRKSAHKIEDALKLIPISI
jgi:hypothetical protein